MSLCEKLVVEVDADIPERGKVLYWTGDESYHTYKKEDRTVFIFLICHHSEG